MPTQQYPLCSKHRFNSKSLYLELSFCTPSYPFRMIAQHKSQPSCKVCTLVLIYNLLGNHEKSYSFISSRF